MAVGLEGCLTGSRVFPSFSSLPIYGKYLKLHFWRKVVPNRYDGRFSVVIRKPSTISKRNIATALCGVGSNFLNHGIRVGINVHLKNICAV